MAKITAPLMSLRASGNFAGAVTFAQQRGRNIARSLAALRLRPPSTHGPAPTPAQAAQRLAYGEACDAWNLATVEDRNAHIPTAQRLNVSLFSAWVHDYLNATFATWDDGATTWDAGASRWDYTF